MPKKTELHNILLLGSGPIVIGQACEFDYAGVQACKALRAAGCRVILVNPNPASIMTDIDIADATYLEPINWQSVAKIIEKERPDALLPIMGGQTALNCTLDLIRHGILSKFSVEMIGVTEMTIRKAEDRQLFVESMRKIGLSTPKSQLIHTLPQVEEISTHFNFPVFMRTSFTLGGTGCGIAHSVEEMLGFCQHAFQLSPETGILVEEALLGWKEYELEVMRDNHDNCIVVCSIENLDPIGIHTGDSATVAPAQTLTDKEYQQLRNAAFSIMREVGITSGGCNIQFAVHPVDGRVMVIEMNPRVSRSSALASKATGYPIAKVATQLALGYTLAELQSEIIGSNIPASFEPALDYIVTKLPRFNMEKFPQANHQLNAQMRSIGEVMAVGRTFQESLQKALCSLENDAIGFTFKIKSPLIPTDCEILREYLRHPTPYRLWHIAAAFRENMSVNEVHELTQIDPWFLVQIQQLIQEEERLIQDTKDPNSVLDMVKLRQLKRKGFSDARIAELLGLTEQFIRDERMRLGIQPVYKRIDSCAAEFPSNTNFFYSTYEDECEAERNTNKKILIIGSGPNRIGQGIEFDYCCVHAIFALKAAGYETVLVNCNPETVSTDYDVADRLYFEPLTLEHILSVIECEKPMGVLVQYGGQAPLKLATALELAGVKLLGTSVEAIERTEDRSRCQTLFKMLRLNQPKNLVVHNQAEVQQLAKTIRYPVVVRPSYVLGGETMRIAFDKKQLIETTEKALAVSHSAPVLLESFLEDSIEVEIDAICDGEVVYVPGIIEHLERAGIHSGDSTCIMPSQRISSALQAELIWQTTKIALELKVIGLMNVQFAVRQGRIYLLEVNLRASRTIPFLTKMTGIPLAQIAVNCILGKTLEEQQLPSPSFHSYVYMKKSVFPFKKFQEQDPVLGLQMQSTGEVMAIASNFDAAYAKAVCAGSDNSIFHSKDTNLKQQCFLSLNAEDYAIAQELTQTLLQLGWNVMVSTKLFNYLEKQGITDIIPIENTEAAINDLCEMLRAKKLHFVLAIDAPLAPGVWKKVRIQAIQSNIYLAFTAQEARAYFQALQKNEHLYPHSLLSLQEIHEINDRREKISLPHFFDKVSIQRVERTFISAY